MPWLIPIKIIEKSYSFVSALSVQKGNVKYTVQPTEA